MVVLTDFRAPRHGRRHTVQGLSAAAAAAAAEAAMEKAVDRFARDTESSVFTFGEDGVLVGGLHPFNPGGMTTLGRFP